MPLQYGPGYRWISQPVPAPRPGHTRHTPPTGQQNAQDALARATQGLTAAKPPRSSAGR
ncbi:hypothetical protein [Delftia sp. 60]|uniref:hypothetical protein n=1 Tax=Delftia sp. 60 TaxID=2035216 RepID=UPI0015D48697|nr:hypothetical protein [Delftia sp. 60]